MPRADPSPPAASPVRLGQHGRVRFSSRQTYTHGVGDVVDAYADPGLYDALPDLPQIGRPQVLDHRRDGGLVHLDIRYAYVGDLPAAALTVIDPTRLTWVQRTAVDLDRHRCRLTLLPDHYPDRLECTGEFAFASLPTAGGSERRVEGDLRVRVMVVGGQVERALVSGLAEFLTAEAAAVDAWIAALG